jgi:hypothetical protein
MSKTTRLTQGLPLAMLTLVLSGGALNLWAQAEQPSTIEPAPPEQVEEQETGDDSTESPAVVPEETDVENPVSPFDYQSSEEISEDLSVSFPVDI